MIAPGGGAVVEVPLSAAEIGLLRWAHVAGVITMPDPRRDLAGATAAVLDAGLEALTEAVEARLRLLAAMVDKVEAAGELPPERIRELRAAIEAGRRLHEASTLTRDGGVS